METATLWNAFQNRRDEATRQKLLGIHVRLVHHIARSLTGRMHLELEHDDLISAGMIGLMNAIEHFEPARGLAFSTFAAPRIRGAMLDEVRRWDHMPRSVRKKQRQISSAKQHLMTGLNRPPSSGETAKALGIEVEKLWRWESDAADAAQVSLDQPVAESDDRALTHLETVAGSSGEEIEDQLNHAEEVAILRREILKLKDRERTVLALSYIEGLKLHQIATVLGLSESRVCQIRSSAIRTLRSRLSALREG